MLRTCFLVYMSVFMDILQTVGTGGLYVFMALLCLVGVGLSCVSISGTWLVVAATVIAAFAREDAFPGVWTVVVFVGMSLLVEVAEALAGAWGVRRRGGSHAAGVWAVLGGLLGMVLGTLIPIPVVGSLIGMMTGSFVLVFLVERRRLAADKAAGIAWGAVAARMAVILLKVVVTLGMSVALFWGMWG